MGDGDDIEGLTNVYESRAIVYYHNIMVSLWQGAKTKDGFLTKYSEGGLCASWGAQYVAKCCPIHICHDCCCHNCCPIHIWGFFKMLFYQSLFHPALGSSCSPSDLVQGLCLSLILISRPDSGFGAIVRLNNLLWGVVGTSVWFSLQSQTDRVALPLWNIIPVVKKMDQQECFFLNHLSTYHQIVVILVMSTHCDGFSVWKSDSTDLLPFLLKGI